MSNGAVIVTGAGGYIGPHVVKALLDTGHSVAAVVRPGSVARLDPRATLIEMDILADDVELDIFEHAEGLVHLAWQDGFAHNSSAHMSQVSSHYRFVTGAAARGCPRIVTLGTMHEVGYWEGAINAETPTNPLNQYGIAKDALRRSLPLALTDTSMAWVRCYYIYGDDRRNNSVFKKILDAVDAGSESFPFTTGRNRYDFIRVEDLGRQIAAVFSAAEETGVINCCSGEPVSLADKVEQFITENRLPITLEYGAFPDRPYDSPGVWGDATRIKNILRSIEQV